LIPAGGAIMASRGGPKKPLADFHLWEAVADTVLPLKPRRRIRPPAPSMATVPVAPPPKRARIIAMPAYQSPGDPGVPAIGRIEPNIRKKLGRGRIAIDGTLDLHGMRQDEAHDALIRYLNAAARRGARTVLVITGKGLKKLNGDPTTIVERGVLRTMLPYWLSGPDLMPLVAGWDQSAQGHGGEGAWYVRLRRMEQR